MARQVTYLRVKRPSLVSFTLASPEDDKGTARSSWRATAEVELAPQPILRSGQSLALKLSVLRSEV